MHLTKSDDEWGLDYEDLSDWEITTLQSIDFLLCVYDEDHRYLFEFPVSLTVDYPVTYP